LVIVNERSASKAVSNEVIGIMQDRLARSAEKTYSICKLSQDFVQKAVDTSLSFGEVALKQAGGIQITGKTATWNGLNQFTQVRSGQTHRGRAYVVNAWYITAYEPLQNAKGEIIGMFYVGIRQESLALLREAISIQSHSGDHSSVAVYYGPGSQNVSNSVVIEPTGIGAATESKWLPE